MDYSKKDGGTRVLDAMKMRTLATGIGQTHMAAREHGSHRAQRVIAGIKPGQIVADRGLRPHVEKRDADEQDLAKCKLEQVPAGPGDPMQSWPMLSGSKSHAQAGEMMSDAKGPSDQGEQTRVPTTGGKRHRPIMVTPLNRSGR
jgi:hypothetical protein